MGKGKGRSGHYNNYRAYQRTHEGLMAKEYINYVAPHLYSAFCLVLYDKYKWEPDELWDRAAREGWDIKANCAECTGIDVTHFRDSGRINKLEVVQDGEEG